MDEPLASVTTSTGWIAGQVRRASRNSLIWNGVTLLLFALIAWFSRNYYYNFFFGPFSYDDARLLKTAENPGNGNLLAYIELKDRQLLETGWEEISTTDGKPYSMVPYFMTPVGDKLMIVMAKDAKDGQHLVGPLYKVRDREAGVIAFMEERHPELRGKFLPVQLNGVAAFPVIGWIGLIIGVPVILLCLFNVSRAIWAIQHPFSHRIVRHLAKYGDPKDIVAGIDREMAAGPISRYGKSHLTSLWLLRPMAFGMITVQLSDIVWMYHLQQTESFAVLCLRTGKAIPMPLRGEQVDKLLREVSERVPWALYGYDVETLKMWRKKPADVVALSDQQRAKHLAGT
jgi:hypothetical protein